MPFLLNIRHCHGHETLHKGTTFVVRTGNRLITTMLINCARNRTVVFRISCKPSELARSAPVRVSR